MSRSKRLKTPLAWLLASEGQVPARMANWLFWQPHNPNSLQFVLPALTDRPVRRIAGLDLIVLVDPKVTYLAERECHGAGELQGNTGVNVKLLLSPRQSRGITHFIYEYENRYYEG